MSIQSVIKTNIFIICGWMRSLTQWGSIQEKENSQSKKSNLKIIAYQLKFNSIIQPTSTEKYKRRLFLGSSSLMLRKSRAVKKKFGTSFKRFRVEECSFPCLTYRCIVGYRLYVHNAGLGTWAWSHNSVVLLREQLTTTDCAYLYNRG